MCNLRQADAIHLLRLVALLIHRHVTILVLRCHGLELERVVRGRYAVMMLILLQVRSQGSTLAIVAQRGRDGSCAVELETVVRVVAPTVLQVALDLIHFALEVLIESFFLFADELVQLILALINHLEDVLNIVIHVDVAFESLFKLSEAQVVADGPCFGLALRCVISMLSPSARLALLVPADALRSRLFH